MSLACYTILFCHLHLPAACKAFIMSPCCDSTHRMSLPGDYYTLHNRHLQCKSAIIMAYLHPLNVNVNVFVYSLMSPSVPHTSQFTPLVFEHSNTVSSPLWMTQHLLTLLQLYAIITIELSSSTRYPSLLGRHRCHDIRGLHGRQRDLSSGANHPNTHQARRCLTSVILWELVTTRPNATMFTPSYVTYDLLILTTTY